jgi:hypothetical protein
LNGREAQSADRIAGGAGYRAAGHRWLSALVILPALLLAGAPADAQRIISTATDLASPAAAVKDSVQRRPRTEWTPIGIVLGNFLRGDELAGLPDIAQGPGRGQHPRAPTQLQPGEAPSRPVIGERGRDSFLDSFVVHPGIEVSMSMDDNLYRDASGEKDDLIYTFEPSLRIRSEWLNHALNITMRGSIGRHTDYGSEDFEDFLIQVAPTLDIDENTTLNLNLGYQSTHLVRGSTDDQLEGPEPAINRVIQAGARWFYQADRYSSQLSYSYQGVDSQDNGAIDRDPLDNDAHTITWRNGYEFAPGTSFWIQPNYDTVGYRRSRDASGYNRDNAGWRLLAGLTYDANAIVFAEIGAGYMWRGYDQPGLDDASGLSVEARMLWNAAPLFTVELAGGRVVRSVESSTASAAIDDSLNLKAAWDPLPNLIFDSSIGFTTSDFESIPGSTRTEDFFSGSLGAKYLANDNIVLQLRYSRSDLDSNINASDYTSNVLVFRFGLEL